MARMKKLEQSSQKRGRGRPPTGLTPRKEDLVRLYVKEEKSIREVAEALGRSKDIVARAFKRYGIEARANASRSRLRTSPLRDLEAAVRQKGLRGTARDLGVDHSTLQHHLKVRSSQ
jgi:DNA-binding CsgD family transcriptional regulator